MGGNQHHLRPVADNIWIVDAGHINAAGFSLPVRMTVIRLTSGDLLLHSPTRYSQALHQELTRIGPIKHLLAPNIAHWMFLPQWQKALPEAKLSAAPGLAGRAQVRRSGLRIDRELGDTTPHEWAEDIELVLITSLLFSEIELFHKPSRTLVLTDLVQNLAPERLSFVSRAVANLLGITAPDGTAPAYLRLLLRLGGRPVEQAVSRLLRMRPERVIFAHGRWFESGGTQQLRRSLAWLPSAEGKRCARDSARSRCASRGRDRGIERHRSCDGAGPGAQGREPRACRPPRQPAARPRGGMQRAWRPRHRRPDRCDGRRSRAATRSHGGKDIRRNRRLDQ
jgi:hypothetical protein